MKGWFKEYFFCDTLANECTEKFVNESDVNHTRKDENNFVNQFSGYWKKHEDHKPVFIIFSPNKIDAISSKFLDDVQIHKPTQYEAKQLRTNEATMDLEHAKLGFQHLVTTCKLTQFITIVGAIRRLSHKNGFIFQIWNLYFHGSSRFRD